MRAPAAAFAFLAAGLAAGCTRSDSTAKTGWTEYPPFVAGSASATQEPAVLSTLPPFTLTDQAGAPFGLADLKGKVWVANFIYTRCLSVCPTFTKQMAALEHEANEKKMPLRFVSFSVDPQHDTPAALADYAKSHGADKPDWTFLTGSVEGIQDAVVKGLKIAANPAASGDDPAAMFHGSHFVLVDADGRVRGYYDSEVPERVAAILPDAQKLESR